MAWFNKHLNLTWLIAFACLAGTGIWAINSSLDSVSLFYAAMLLVYLFVSGWVIYKKGHNIFWIIIPISAVLLNNRNAAIEADFTRCEDGFNYIKNNTSPEYAGMLRNKIGVDGIIYLYEQLKQRPNSHIHIKDQINCILRKDILC